MKQRDIEITFLNIREIKRHDKQNEQTKHSSTQISRMRRENETLALSS